MFVKSRDLDPKSFNSKEYHHNHPTERTKVLKEIQTAWNQVKSIADALDVTIYEFTTNSALSQLQTQALDGYDLFMLEAMRVKGISHIITDDGNFATVPELVVFTANRNVIREAKTQNKLFTRNKSVTISSKPRLKG